MTSLINGLGGDAGFGENSLPANDDDSTSQIDGTGVFPNGLNFFGNTWTSLYINNNGNITFDQPQGTYTPFVLTGATSNPIIAAFFADVDTEGGTVAASPGGTSTGSNLLFWDLDSGNGALTATWDDVGYFSAGTDLLNAFQIQLVDRSVGNSPGDFDIRFLYENLEWTTGDASDGIHARAGYSSGNGTDFHELSESGNAAQMLDLVNRTNTGQPGEFVFTVRNGVVLDPPDVQFMDAAVSVIEDVGIVEVELTRTGDLTAGSTVQVAVGTGGASTATPERTLVSSIFLPPLPSARVKPRPLLTSQLLMIQSLNLMKSLACLFPVFPMPRSAIPLFIP
ncbi:MAG: nidogen-like domain-containing protein [Planctomycetaceae bacterium]